MSQTPSRRRLILASLGTTACSLGLFRAVNDRLHLEVVHQNVPLPPEHKHLSGTRLALLSDFHYDDFPAPQLLEEVKQELEIINPDAVFLTGDFISSEVAAADELARALGALPNRHGIFACLGNHDTWHGPLRLTRTLEKQGIRVLSNQSTKLEGMTIVGLESAWAGDPACAATLRGVSQKEAVILLQHEPDPFAHYTDPRILLQLSGHTHGGQLCTPGGNPLRLPYLGTQYVHGLHHRGNRYLYVNRGLGSSVIPLRLFCRPELTVLNLV